MTTICSDKVRQNNTQCCITHVASIVLVRVVHLPPRGGKDLNVSLGSSGRKRTHVLVSVVPGALDDLARVTLILFLCGICQHAHIVVDVKVEQRSRFPARLIDDKVVECIVLGLGLIIPSHLREG